MRVAVWGAGAIGTATAYRLTLSPFVSEVHWINRNVDNIRYRVVDLHHGLAFAPNCHLVKAYAQERAGRALAQADLVVVSMGASVPFGEGRAVVWKKNRECFDESLIPRLRNFGGIVLVVTNPVDLMAGHVYAEASIQRNRCLGLGTVVETGRLRASLAKHVSPMRPAREMFAYAVGTHDDNVVVVADGAGGLGIREHRKETISMARDETVKAAARVKNDARSTLHPVVEGIAAVVDAIASDSQAVMTVSTFDEERRIFYSLPCTLGRDGLVHRHTELWESETIAEDLRKGLEDLKAVLSAS